MCKRAGGLDGYMELVERIEIVKKPDTILVVLLERVKIRCSESSCGSKTSSTASSSCSSVFRDSSSCACDIFYVSYCW